MADDFASVLMRAMGLDPVTPAGQLNLSPTQLPMAAPQGFTLPQAEPQGGFMDALRRDPSLSLALMNAGLSMMQPTKPGSSHLGNVAQGAQQGIATYIGDVQRRQKNAAQDKRLSLMEREVQQREAAGQRAERTLGMTEELQPLREQALRLGLDKDQYTLDLAKRFGAREAQAKLAAAEAQIRSLDAKTAAIKDGTYGVGKGGTTSAQVQVIDKISSVYQGVGVPKPRADELAVNRVYGARSAPVKDALALHKALAEIDGNVFLPPEEKTQAKTLLMQQYKEAVAQTPEAQVADAATKGKGKVLRDPADQAKWDDILAEAIANRPFGPDGKTLIPENDPRVMYAAQRRARELGIEIGDF